MEQSWEAMEANCTDLTERILQLTLEIIYLLTGEDNIVAKKTSRDGKNSIMVPLHSLLDPKRNNEQNILEVTQKIIDLLKEEVPIRCQDVTVYFSMEEWEYLEGHKDLYKDVMMENQPPLTSPDGSSNGNPPERCLHPLSSWDSTQEGHTIPHHPQVDGSSNGNLPERCPRPLYSRDSTQEGHTIPHHPQVHGSSNENPPERCPHPLYSRDSKREGHTISHLHQVDGSCNGNPPDRCPRPLYFWDSTQEGHTIPHHHQVDGSSNKNPPERCPRPLYSWHSTQEAHIISHAVREDIIEEEIDAMKEFSEGHKDPFKEVMVEPFNDTNPSERCPNPLYSQNFTQEDHTIPHHHQTGNWSNFNVDLKEEIKEKEVEDGVMKDLEGHKVLDKEIMMENEPLLTIPDGSSNGNPPERCPHPLYSWDSTQEDHTISHMVREEIKEEEEVDAMKEFSEGYKDPFKEVMVEPFNDTNPLERCPHPLDSGDFTKEDHTISLTVKEEIKEEDEEVHAMEEFSEGHKDPFKEVMVEPFNDTNPPERCPCPLYSQDFTLEDHTIPQHHQVDGDEQHKLKNNSKDEERKDIEAEVKEEEEEMLVSGDQQSMEEGEMIMRSKVEESSLHVDTNGSSNGNPLERCPRPLYSLDSTQEDHTSSYTVREEIKEEEEEVDAMEEFSEEHRDPFKEVVAEPFNDTNPPERCPHSLYSGDSTREDHTISNAVKEEIKEEDDEVDVMKDFLEGHKDPFTEVMVEQFSGAHPQYSWDSIQEDHNYAQPKQNEELKHLKAEIKEEEEETLVSGDQQSMEEEERTIEIKHEESYMDTNGSSNRNPPERCPRPLYSWDSTQEDHTIPHHHQGEEVLGIKLEVEEVEEMDVICEQLPIEEQVMVTITKEESSPDVSSGGANVRKTLKEHPTLSADCKKENNCMAQYPPGLIIFAPNIHHKPKPMVRPRDRFICRPPNYKLRTILPKGQPIFHSAEQPPDLSNHKESSEESKEKPCTVIPTVQPSFHILGQPPDPSKRKETSEVSNDKPCTVQPNFHWEPPDPSNQKEPSEESKDKPHTVIPNVQPSFHIAGQPPDPSNYRESSEESKDKPHTVIPNVQQSFHIAGQPPDPSSPEESSPSNLHSLKDCEKSSLKNHDPVVNQKTHTSKKWFSCSECEKCLKKKSDIVQHQRVHTSEKPYSCPECGKGFSRKVIRDSHIRTHTGEKPFCCSECGQSFAQKVTLIDHCLDQHVELHEMKAPQSCSECGKSFEKISEFHVRLKGHTSKEICSCPGCEKSVKRKCDPVEHQRTHTGEPPCKKSLKNSWKIVRHKRSHNGEKPFSCSECGKTFAERSQLKAHQIVHTGEKPFTCSECGKGFSSKGNRDKHMKIHTGEKPFSCSECGKRFTQKITLINHQRVHTRRMIYPKTYT